MLGRVCLQAGYGTATEETAGCRVGEVKNAVNHDRVLRNNNVTTGATSLTATT